MYQKYSLKPIFLTRAIFKTIFDVKHMCLLFQIMRI